MNIRISKHAHLCAACGNDFQHEATITSTVKKQEGALHREDFCKDCWRAERNKEAYSVWNMVYYDPKLESEQPAEVFSPLRQLFYEAAEEDTRIEMAKAFLAAGLLRRQKVFRLIKESDEAEGAVRVTLYTDRLGNRLIEVPDPQFTYAELETARANLLARLQELEEAAAASEAPASDETPEAGSETTKGTAAETGTVESGGGVELDSAPPEEPEAASEPAAGNVPDGEESDSPERGEAAVNANIEDEADPSHDGDTADTEEVAHAQA